jgi:hypothetical protein
LREQVWESTIQPTPTKSPTLWVVTAFPTSTTRSIHVHGTTGYVDPYSFSCGMYVTMTNTTVGNINFTSSVPTALLSMSKGFKSSVDAVAP